MNTAERVALKRKAMRYDTIVRWAFCPIVIVIVLLVTGWVDALR